MRLLSQMTSYRWLMQTNPIMKCTVIFELNNELAHLASSAKIASGIGNFACPIFEPKKFSFFVVYYIGWLRNATSYFPTSASNEFYQRKLKLTCITWRQIFHSTFEMVKRCIWNWQAVFMARWLDRDKALFILSGNMGNMGNVDQMKLHLKFYSSRCSSISQRLTIILYKASSQQPSPPLAQHPIKLRFLITTSIITFIIIILIFRC